MASHDTGALKPTSIDAHSPPPILFHANLLREWGKDSSVSSDLAIDRSSVTLRALSEGIAPVRDSSSATMGASTAVTNIHDHQASTDPVDPAYGISSDRISGGVSSNQTDEVTDLTSDITSEITSNQPRNNPPRSLVASDIIVVQDGGDLTLTVGADASKAAFLVSRKTLELKCPKLMQPATKPAFNEGILYIFDGYDWDASPMRIVLDVAHGNFHRLPRWITFVTLAQLAQLAEGCDLVELLLPFVSQGLSSLAHQAHAAHLSWIHISWVFGFRKLFHAHVEHCIENVTSIDGQISLFEPADVKAFLPNACDNELYDIIEKSRAQRLEKLSQIIKNFSNLKNWIKHAPCQLSEEMAAWERDQCAMLRYAFFQGAINEKFKTLEGNPQSVEESIKSCVAALLHIDCIVDAEAQPAPSTAYFQKVGHDECGFHAFKEAIYKLYEYDEQRSDSLQDLMYRHFDRHDTTGVPRLSGEGLFGNLLHPASGLFIEADMPSDSQMAKHREIAQRRKVIKVFKQEPDMEGANEELAQQRGRGSSVGLFVTPTRDRTHEITEGSLLLDTTPPTERLIECLNSDNELPDDADYDSDSYNLDEEWELDSNCSTEPDDEYFEDINEIEVYRQLRGVKQTTPPVEKRKRTQAVDLTAEEEPPTEESPKRKKKKLSKEEKKRVKRGSPKV